MIGPAATNKGLALFPRRIGGRFVALSRHDRETNAVAYSDSLLHWDDAVTIQTPDRPWELIQLGNCGSPIETEAGWLVLTHGVGPMRTYSIGALLLDVDDPTAVVAGTARTTPHTRRRTRRLRPERRLQLWSAPARRDARPTPRRGRHVHRHLDLPLAGAARVHGRADAQLAGRAGCLDQLVRGDVLEPGLRAVRVLDHEEHPRRVTQTEQQAGVL